MANKYVVPTLKPIRDDDVIGMVQGVMPDSKNEWFVALALDKLQIDYQFQVALYGGTTVRGGQVVDFVVYNPDAIPVFIQGSYWHNQASETEDLLKQRAAEEWYKKKPILLSEEDTNSKDKAFQTVKQEIA